MGSIRLRRFSASISFLRRSRRRTEHHKQPNVAAHQGSESDNNADGVKGDPSDGGNCDLSNPVISHPCGKIQQRKAEDTPLVARGGARHPGFGAPSARRHRVARRLDQAAERSTDPTGSHPPPVSYRTREGEAMTDMQIAVALALLIVIAFALLHSTNNTPRF
ncbi:MAG TPA: hypothetical protein VGI32_17975 [Steroidobacteraceae bacterium]